jgi:hypothetical protein
MPRKTQEPPSLHDEIASDLDAIRTKAKVHARRMWGDEATRLLEAVGTFEAAVRAVEPHHYLPQDGIERTIHGVGR